MSMQSPIYPSPKVFISYAWDGEDSNNWVKNMATDLRNNGIDASLDQWRLVPGDRLPFFMEQSVKANKYVLIICTPKYKFRSENRVGGVGYEGDIMSAEILQDTNSRKFIPILQAGDKNTAVPGWLSGRIFVDFTNHIHYVNSFDVLMRTLLDLRGPEPDLGAIPTIYLQEMEAMRQKQQQNDTLQLETTVVDQHSADHKQRLTPFLEADLIWHGGSRSPRGYSDKNPKELDENGRYVTVIGAGVKPIIFWELGWRFELVIYNNSSFPAFNVHIESIGNASLNTLEKLDEINNLKPFDQIQLHATFSQFVEGVHTVADEIIAKKIPTKLEGLTLKISYRSENHDHHSTTMKIQDGKVINLKE